VTEALIRRGIDESRLVLLEYNLDFCRLLHARFPKATIVHGDAYRLKETLAGHLPGPPAAIVSGLPLFTKPEWMRRGLLDEALDLAQPGAPFVQFTYAVVSPVPLKAGGFEAKAGNRIWRNLPPARVWIYRRPVA
jgi:phosphatidylethanolamine/phosphatidyl-N-methylethanolamine N-methyltransferase